MPKRKTRKIKMRKGAGHTQSRPRIEPPPLSNLPPLPETPTNKPKLFTNKEGLMNPPKESEEYQKRAKRLGKSLQNAREQPLINIFLGKKRQEVPRNNYGPLQSYFLLKKNKGFKPSKPES